MQKIEGIVEKLKRADENIYNLHGEIEGFFEKGEYPVLPQQDDELFSQAIAYHSSRVIPPRFSVLAGEVVHHLRSCFDHIVWHFSDFSLNPVKNIRKIEFPVFSERPSNQDGRKLFEGKIAGITKPSAPRSLIERLQPYNSPDPAANPLYIIHDFDIIDKHKELVICFASGTAVFPTEMRAVLETYHREHPKLDRLEVAVQFKDYGVLQPTYRSGILVGWNSSLLFQV